MITISITFGYGHPNWIVQIIGYQQTITIDNCLSMQIALNKVKERLNQELKKLVWEENKLIFGNGLIVASINEEGDGEILGYEEKIVLAGYKDNELKLIIEKEIHKIVKDNIDETQMD